MRWILVALGALCFVCLGCAYNPMFNRDVDYSPIFVMGEKDKEVSRLRKEVALLREENALLKQKNQQLEAVVGFYGLDKQSVTASLE